MAARLSAWADGQHFSEHISLGLPAISSAISQEISQPTNYVNVSVLSEYLYL